MRVSTDGHTHARTDAKRFYYLPVLYAIAMGQIMIDFVTLPEEDRATAIGNITHIEDLVNIARVVLEISSWTDRQTHTQTQTYLLQYFATAPVVVVVLYKMLSLVG